MKALESFKKFEENNLSVITGGKEYSWQDTNNGGDEYQVTHEEGSPDMDDGLYDCEAGDWTWGGNL